MNSELTETVLVFYAGLFDALFFQPFAAAIPDPTRRRKTQRQIEDAADAAAQSLIRFFTHQDIGDAQREAVLQALSPLAQGISLDLIAHAGVLPETLLETYLAQYPLPSDLERQQLGPVYRVALHGVLQVLTLVGPIMAEWRKLNFSSTFELLQRVIDRLNRISEQLGKFPSCSVFANSLTFVL